MKGRKRIGLVMALVLVFAMMMAAFPGAVGADINVPPIAEAGPDQAVHQTYDYDGSDVTLDAAYPVVKLDGSGSFDLNLDDTLTYSWSPVSGPPATITPYAPPGEDPRADVTLDGGAGTYVFELTVLDDGGLPAPVPVSDTVTVYAGTTWFVRITGNDGWNGLAYTRNAGVPEGPFRTITYAIGEANTGDRILVGPTDEGTPFHYGDDDGAKAEEITVNKSFLTIQSLEGRDNTLIDVSEQNASGNSGNWEVDQVVEIVSDHVVFGSDDPLIDLPGMPPFEGHGFTLTGAPKGIYAHSADYVYIHLNKIELKDCDCRWDIGIKVMDSKMPIIDHNIIDISCTDDGVGILVVNAQAGPALPPSHGLQQPQTVGAQVTYNEVIIDAVDTGEGIVLINSPKALVDNNDVFVDVGPSFGLGIGVLFGSDLAEVTNNIVTVWVAGGTWAVGIGIEVMHSERVTVGGNEQVVASDPGLAGSLGNTVNVTVSVGSGEAGGLLAIGIHLTNALRADVDDNYVNVLGGGIASLSDSVDARGVASLDGDGAELADLQKVVDEFGFSTSVSGGLVLGILAWHSDWIDVTENEVHATADMLVNVSARWLAVGEGAALSFGIVVLCSALADVLDNDVFADAITLVDVAAEDPGFWIFPPVSISSGNGLAAALGIVVALSNMPDVIGNLVQAHGDVKADVYSRGGVLATEESDSVIAKLDSDVLSVVYDIVTDSVESDEVGAQIIGDPKAAILATAEGGALGLGIGIMTLLSEGARVNLNIPVLGLGTVEATVYAMEWTWLGGIATARAGGLGLGIGILDVSCRPTEVNFNNVTGEAYASVDGQAAEMGGIASLAIADSSAAGVGLGILVIGLVTQGQADEVDAESIPPPSMTSVIRNTVAADGVGHVEGAAYDRSTFGDALAYANALGLGMGIVVVRHWAPAIVGNTVGTENVAIMGDADAHVYAAAISCVDPFAWGVSHGIGIGIMAVLSPFAYITDNQAIAVGDAYGEVTAIEEMVVADIIAEADGTSIGVGVGIVVAMSSGASVGPNNPEEEGQSGQGTGIAEVKAVAVQHEPLDDAIAGALGIGIGKGIVVAYLCNVDVIESNTFIGNSTVTVNVEALGDYAQPAGLGLALGIDESAVLVYDVVFNYNDMPTLGGSSGSGPVLVIDLGLLAVLASQVDARYQWWGNPSGPTTDAFVGAPPFEYNVPFGQPIEWVLAANVQYVPWLWDNHKDQVRAHIGKYGKYIELLPSRNFFSTPIALDERADEWIEILTLSGVTGGIDAPLSWNPLLGPAGEWEVVTTLEPLTGYYTVVDQFTTLIFLASVGDSMPTKQLEIGWNLIGPNPLFCQPDMPVGYAIGPVARTDGYAGFSHVLSNAQPPNWSYTLMQWRSNDPGPDMLTGRGYWVRMNSAELLSGSGFTPIGLYPNP